MRLAIITIYAALALPAMAAPASQSWVKDEAALEPGAQIYLGTQFGSKKGTFKSQPESMLDTSDSIAGSFVVADYRYVYSKPERDGSGKLFDELVSTEVLDCKRHYFGTARQVRLRKGVLVSQTVTPDADLLMMQMNGENIDTKLCALHAGKPSPALERAAVNNPGYNPHPSDKDVDALIDKYGKPRQGKAK